MGRRGRQRERAEGREALQAPSAEYRDELGGALTLRGSLTPRARRQYQDILAGGLDREDSWQRATEFLFERLALSWEIAGVACSGQRELLGRYRLASTDERRFVRDALRRHLAEQFPELQAP